MGGWPMRDLEGYIKYQREIGATICHACGAEGVEIRQIHDDPYGMCDVTEVCKECWDEVFDPKTPDWKPATPDWDDLPIVED